MWKRVLAVAILVPLHGAGHAIARDSNVPQLQQTAYSQAKQLLRGVKADIYEPNQDVAAVFADFLQIERKASTELSGTLLTGCRPHSCMEKAAALIDPSTGALSGIALASFECRHGVLAEDEIAFREARSITSRPGTSCRKTPTLRVYLIRRQHTPAALRAERTSLERFRTWGTSAGTQGEHVTVVRP